MACGKKLAKGQWWSFCGQVYIGPSMPALCTECGGDFALEVPSVAPKIDRTMPVPALPDEILTWPGKEEGKPKPGIVWLDDANKAEHDLEAQVTELKEVIRELISMYYSMACDSIPPIEHERIIAKAEKLARQS